MMTGAWGTGVIVTVAALFVIADSKICETRGDAIFEETGVISCPEPGDPDHFTDCCGPSWTRRCCAKSNFNSFLEKDDNDLSFSWEEDDDDIVDGAKGIAKDNISHLRPKRKAQNLESLETLPQPQALNGKSIIKFVGIVIGLVIFLVVVSIICCCCLPCCFLAKRRTNRGAVHGPGYQGAGTGAPQQAELLQQGGAYPPQGAYQPQSAYPPQGAYPPQNAYPPQGAPPGYSDQPPPYPGPPAEGYPAYPTKQPAFNPNM